MKKPVLETLLFAYGGVILALLAGSALTQYRAWGFSWYGYFAPLGPVVLLTIGVSLAVVLLRNRTLKNLAPSKTESTGARIWPAAIVAAAVGGATFVLLSARTHFLGDGLQLLARLAESGPPVRPWNPGAYFVQDSLYRMLGGDGSEVAQLAFRIISWTAGIIFSLVLMATSGCLFGAWRDRLLFFLGVLTGGYALLFFGYVENYPLFVLGVGLFALFGLLVLRDKLGRYWPVAPLALSGLFHPYGVLMLPACAYLIIRDTRLANRLSAVTRHRRIGAGVALVAVLGATAYYLYTQSYMLRFALVPLVENQFTAEGYTLLSFKHLSDWVNLLFVLAPALPLALVVLSSKSVRGWSRRAEYRFLLLMLVPSLAATFLIDPKLGMARDWDTFGFAGIPLVLLVAYGLLDPKNRVKGYVPATVMVIGINVMVLAPRVLVPTMPDKAIAWFDDVTDLDVLKSSSGRFIMLNYLEESGRTFEAERRRDENARLFPHQGLVVRGRELMEAGKLGQAEAMFRQAIASAPTYSNAWTDLAIVHIQRDQFDSALSCLNIADGLNPYNPDTYDCFGQVYLFSGDLVRGEAYCLEAARRDPDNFTARGNLLRLYQKQGRLEDFEATLMEIAWLTDAPLEYVAKAAAVYLKRGQYEPAGRALRRALSLGFDSAVVRQLQRQHPLLKVIP